MDELAGPESLIIFVGEIRLDGCDLFYKRFLNNLSKLFKINQILEAPRGAYDAQTNTNNKIVVYEFTKLESVGCASMDNMECAVVPKLTAFQQPDQLSVVSSNLLAPIFVRPIDLRSGTVQEFAAFAWAEPADEVLDWGVRMPRLLKELSGSNADVICLQEVQFEPSEEEARIATELSTKLAALDTEAEEAYAANKARLEAEAAAKRTELSCRFVLPSWLRLEGYAAKLPDQASLSEMADRNMRVLGIALPVGNALLYRPDRLELVAETDRDATTRVCVVVQGKAALSALGPTAVFCVHLDATSEDKRVKQLVRCLEQARGRRVRQVVIAGDMNTEVNPGSCVAGMLANSPTPTAQEFRDECMSNLRLEEGETASEQHLNDWMRLHQLACEAPSKHRTSLGRADTGATRSCYDHGKSSGPCVPWRLDHILFSQDSLKARARWATLEADPEAMLRGLPCHWCPSDHLPIGVSFEPVPMPVLDQGQQEALEQRLCALNQKQLLQMECLVGELLQTQLGIEAEELAAKAEADQQMEAVEPPNKCPKKKKKSRPSPRMTEFIRKKRDQVRAVQAELRAEREEVLATMNECELDIVEVLLGKCQLSLEDYLESGTLELKKAAKK